MQGWGGEGPLICCRKLVSGCAFVVVGGCVRSPPTLRQEESLCLKARLDFKLSKCREMFASALVGAGALWESKSMG